MNTNKLLLSLTALMLACTPMAGADIPDPDGVCDGDEPPTVQCEVIAGPASLTVKGVLSVGIGFCQTETTSIPLQCDGTAGAINGAGAATFGNATWNGQKLININVVWDQQGCTSTNTPPCGFTVSVCNDRDQDSTCTNIGDQDDELHDAHSGEDIVGDCNKDPKKMCANQNEAGLQACMDDSVFDDWSNDQIVVFVGVSVGATETNPEIAKVSSGTYTVWVEDLGSCTQGPDPTPSSGCIWARTPDADLGIDIGPAIDGIDAAITTLEGDPTAVATAAGQIEAGVSGSDLTPDPDLILYDYEVCDDDGGNPINFTCTGGTLLVVLHVGPGHTTASPNTCTAVNPQTADTANPVNAQAIVNPAGTFQCSFYWAIAGAGGCIVV